MIYSTTQHYLIPDSISEVALQTSVKAILSYVIGGKQSFLYLDLSLVGCNCNEEI